MLASNLLKNSLRNASNEDNWIQLELHLRWKMQDIKKIIVTLANLQKSYNLLQLQVDNTLKIMFFIQKLLKLAEYNKNYS